MTENLTKTQKRILSFITDCVRLKGFPPTMREIGERLGITAPSSVAYHLRLLESKGFLKRSASVSRGLSLPANPLQVPILGRVGAGSGMIAQEDLEGQLSADEDVLAGTDFLLRVRGRSMDGAGIIEGDLVQVRRQDAADNGDLVVALVADEGVVKRLKKRGRKWLLESANPDYEPIESFKIVGKVVGLIRRYGR